MLQWLLESDFMPHGHCFLWRPDILWVHVLSDAVIALAYFSIPVTLLYFARKRRDLPFRWVFALFAAFIVLCGVTHVLSIVTIWTPVYAFEGVIKAITAVVSIFTALGLIPLVPEALSLPSRAQLEVANQALAREVHRRTETERKLEQTVTSLNQSNHALEQFARVASDELKSPVQDIVALAALLQKENNGQLSKEAEGYLQHIEATGWRMHKLVNDQLVLSRVQIPAPA
jgi:signal transduction histidine kinase